MAEGNLSADGSSPWFELTYDDFYLSLNGSFGGGSVALEKMVNNKVYPVRESGAPISIPSEGDISVNMGSGIKVRLTLSGSTGADIDWAIAARQARMA